MDEKQDLQSPRHDATTPLLSGEGTSDAPRTTLRPLRMRLYLLPDPFWRLRMHLFTVGVILFWISLILWSDIFRASLPDSRGYDTSSVQESTLSTSGKSSSKVTKVATLPEGLIPKTYVHHSPANRRLIVVGDVHGTYAGLKELLNHISYNGSNDHLIFAGDMINKGPQSHKSVSLIRSLGSSCVRGNHEDRILALRSAYDADPDLFASNDSRDLDTAKQLSKKDVVWLQQCPLILRLPPMLGQRHKETVIVHAGILPLVKLRDQKPFDVMHMRSISKLTGKGKGKHKHKGSRVKFQAYEDRNEGDEPWWKVWNKVQGKLSTHDRTLVLYGHDAHTGLIEKDWSLGLDSACVTGGRLSAMVFEGLDEKTGKTREKIESISCEDLV